jgi:hypothetical protein
MSEECIHSWPEIIYNEFWYLHLSGGGGGGNKPKPYLHPVIVGVCVSLMYATV